MLPLYAAADPIEQPPGSAKPLYLDHASSTPPASEVVEAMMPWLTRTHANPHSDHLHGQRASAAIETAREQIAELVGCNSDEVIFTSSATEANNLALQGLLASPHRTQLLAVGAAAHKSVLEVANVLGARGIQIVRLSVGHDAAISPEILAKALKEHGPADVGLVSATHGNNETGTLQELSELADIVHEYGYFFHVDAAQTAGKVPFDVVRDAVDLASLSSHKMYGPAGIGALFVASNVQRLLTPLFYGGGQEQGLRPGTVPVFLAVGFGAAAALARRVLLNDALRLREVANQFLKCLTDRNVKFVLLGDPVNRIPGHVSLHIPEVDAADLLGVVSKDLSASTGAACMSGEVRASHVLRAIGMTEVAASQVIRLTFGRESSIDDASYAANVIASGILRQSQR